MLGSDKVVWTECPLLKLTVLSGAPVLRRTRMPVGAIIIKRHRS